MNFSKGEPANWRIKNNVKKTVYLSHGSTDFAFLQQLAEFRSRIQTEKPGGQTGTLEKMIVA